MRNRRLTLQVVAIFAIIITAFIGSALFFSYLNTDAMKDAVEAEMELSSALLSSSVRAHIFENPAGETQAREALARELEQRLPQVFEEVGEAIGVWVLTPEGDLLYSRGGALPQREWDAAREAIGSGAGVVLNWSGSKNPFWLDQSLFLARQLPESGLYLAMVNPCAEINAVQRRQFTLFAGIELVLVLTMVMLLTNLIFSYRHLLIKLATTDELTSLANRHAFLNAYHEFVGGKSGRPAGDFCLFLADIDFFKQVNDNYGHAAGDLALKTVGQLIRAMAKKHGGFAGRWGGDEFIGWLPLSEEAALAAVSELCADVRGVYMEGGFGITVSAGVAGSNGDTSLTRLSDRADKALYRSKAQGRDQASLYTPADEANAQAAPSANPKAVEAAREAAPKRESSAPAQQPARPSGGRFKRYIREKLLPATLMGVRWMAPFVAAGGILIGLAFLFDASSVDLAALPVSERANFGSITPLAATLKSIGGSTFDFMLPVFTAFMAYSLAGESAFMAGFVGGYMTIASQSGFIGAMIAGLAAGMITGQMRQFIARMPVFVQKAAPIVIYPVFNLMLMQAVSWLVISPISGAVGRLFTGLLDDAVARNGVLAGGLSGAMMAMDMGGIVNKVAYNYAVSGLAQGHTAIMASVMAGGMVPPIGIALSLLLFKHKYSSDERERFAGTLFMGFSFITEGALPFVFTDPGRVIVSCMAGSGLAGLLSHAFGCALPAPHGGMFVLPVIGNPVGYLLALVIGSMLTALILGMWKRSREEFSDSSH